jgi:hypothetical protein
MRFSRLPGTSFVCAALVAQQPAPPCKSGIDLQGMDTTRKPCDDFYRYANGTFLDKNPIPARLPN